ncbi:ankyrin repeat family protein [Prunus dulcis]|uniref:Ankyrin repeat family protein n=1 Tax=Prunus dulcis TaxID=3755 RepID=A0A4Y1RC40_PRUDU|nr:ankyrin repeat family protein [Prunus dulcis]
MAKTPKDNNILHISAEFKKTDFFKNVDGDQFDQLFWATNKKDDTPLHVASRVGCHEIVELLIQHAKKKLHRMERGDEESGPADGEYHNKLLRVTNSDNDTALHLAVRYNHEKVVILLMEADPQLCCITNKAEESPLFLAVRKRSPSIAHRILQAYDSDISPSFQGTNGLTALHVAAAQEKLIDKGVVNMMMSKNHDISREVDAIGWTPLHYAAFTGNVEATQLLLKCDGSTCYMLDESKMSALHVAAYAGHTKVMAELIRCRPDACDLLNSKGQTALHAAVLGGQRGVVKYILRTPKLAGLINEADKDGNTPLHMAVIYKKIEIIDILTSDPRVDRTAINKKLSKPLIFFLVNVLNNRCPVLQQLGSSVGGTFFQQKIRNDFNEVKPSKKDTPCTPAAIGLKRQEGAQASSNQALKRLDTKLVVTTLIATVTFAAGLTPPGGFKTDGTPVSFVLAILAIYNESNPIRFLSIEVATPARLIQYSIGGLLVAFVSVAAAVTPKGHSKEHPQCPPKSYIIKGTHPLISPTNLGISKSEKYIISNYEQQKKFGSYFIGRGLKVAFTMLEGLKSNGTSKPSETASGGWV